jgi:hypothetical protein
MIKMMKKNLTGLKLISEGYEVQTHHHVICSFSKGEMKLRKENFMTSLKHAIDIEV